MRVRPVWFLCVAVLVAASGAMAAAPCQLCAPEASAAPAAPNRPLQIDIETALDFSIAAHTDAGAGSIKLDSRTGLRQFSGLVGVGGAALRGMVTITGQPFRRIRVELPNRIRLNSTQGAKADVTEITSTLTADPMIGSDGRMVFFFGGKLSVIDDAAGEFHGRIQISADYQ